MPYQQNGQPEHSGKSEPGLKQSGPEHAGSGESRSELSLSKEARSKHSRLTLSGRGHFWQHDLTRPLLELKDVTVVLGEEEVLKDISFSVEKGERLAVVGPNGAGKSTLFRTIAGTLTPTSGEIAIYGKKPGSHICIAYVPQVNMIDWDFPVTVLDVVMMGRIRKIGFIKRPGRKDREIAYHSLELVNMEELAGKQIGMLSGGQRQRVFLARAIAQDAEILMMDEPFTGLDVTSQRDLYRIMDNLTINGITLLVSTHDLNAAKKYFTRIMLLNRRIVKIGTGDEVMNPEYLIETFGGHFTIVESERGTTLIEDSCCSHKEEEVGKSHA